MERRRTWISSEHRLNRRKRVPDPQIYALTTFGTHQNETWGEQKFSAVRSLFVRCC